MKTWKSICGTVNQNLLFDFGILHLLKLVSFEWFIYRELEWFWLPIAVHRIKISITFWTKFLCINYVRQDEEFSNISSQCMRVLLLLLFIKICATNYCNRFWQSILIWLNRWSHLPFQLEFLNNFAAVCEILTRKASVKCMISSKKDNIQIYSNNLIPRNKEILNFLKLFNHSSFTEMIQEFYLSLIFSLFYWLI